MLVDGEATRLVEMACSHTTFGPSLRSFVQAMESDHRLRLLNDLEARNTQPEYEIETVLAERARQNELYAALYWIAHRCGPGAPARWDALAQHLKGWSLHEPEDLPMRDKIVDKVAKGFVAECFVAGSAISGTPSPNVIFATLAQVGQDDTPHNRRVLLGEMALTQAVSLLNAAKRNRMSTAELDAWRYDHRRQPSPAHRTEGSPWPLPAYAAGDAIGEGHFDSTVDVADMTQITLHPRIAADYILYPPTKPGVADIGMPEVYQCDTKPDVGHTVPQNRHDQLHDPIRTETTVQEYTSPVQTTETPGHERSETARMFLAMHPTMDHLVALAISRRGNSWNTKTQNQVKGIGRLLVKVVGSDDLASLRPFHVARYRDILNLLPKAYGKSPADAVRSLDEIIAIGVTTVAKQRGLSPGTINRHMTQLGTLLAVLASFDIRLAPSGGMSVLRTEDAVAEDLKRDQFTDEQVRAIFSKAPWNGAPTARENEGFYWLTLLAAYTGARPNELVWLQRQDIDIEQGVANIRKNSFRDLKTRESKRDIVLHSQIVNLGFIDFINRQTDAYAPIFSEYINHRKKDAGQRFTMQFNGILEKIVPGRNGGKLTLYSFRHKFMNLLLRHKVDPVVKDMITGHARTGTRDRVYSKAIEYEQQREVLEHIDFSAGAELQKFVAELPTSRRGRRVSS
jgi:integrase